MRGTGTDMVFASNRGYSHWQVIYYQRRKQIGDGTGNRGAWSLGVNTAEIS